MSQRRRFTIILAIVAALSLLTIVFAAQSGPIERPSDTDLPVVPLTQAPPCPIALTADPSETVLEVGDSLDVLVFLELRPRCSFPLDSLSLRQYNVNYEPIVPIFDYVSPPTHTVSNPGSNPFTYTLAATISGTTLFRARAESGPVYTIGWSRPVHVGHWPHRGYLSVVFRD